MTELPRRSGEAFATERLRENPQLTFEALRQAAELEGITIQPIQYGRARRQLGLTGAPLPTPLDVESKAPPEATPTDPVDSDQITHDSPPDPTEAPVVEIPTPPPAAPAAAPQKKSKPAFEFLVSSLREDGTLSYGELRARSEERGFKIAPIMYGRAKALLGLVPVRPRGQGKNRTAAKAKAAATLGNYAATQPDQFSKQLDSVQSVEDLVRIVKQLDGERRRLRGLLEHIANSIDEALDQPAIS